MLRGKHIVIGVTGGIAAYKAVYILRELQNQGAHVRVVMTEAATRFVGKETFAALTRNDVPVSLFPENKASANENWTQHIQWAEWADIILIAPCTANTLAKIVHGFSDSMLTAIVLASRCPVLLCPTMDGEMYQAPATQSNLSKALKLGFHILEPDSGYLASGLSGPGRLPDETSIIQRLTSVLTESKRSQESPSAESRSQNVNSTKLLKGKKVVVTCGPTREFFDPVRFLSNPSTGKMGMAMASAAHGLGAQVVLLHADSVNTSALPEDIQKKTFISADDLFELVKRHKDADVFVMAAAVSDFKPTITAPGKIKKEEADPLISLIRTPDILAWLGKIKKEGQMLVGFAMETENLADNARIKRVKKNADWIIANNLSEDGAGFAVDTNKILVIGDDDEYELKGLKKDLSYKIFEHIC